MITHGGSVGGEKNTGGLEDFSRVAQVPQGPGREEAAGFELGVVGKVGDGVVGMEEVGVGMGVGECSMGEVGVGKACDKEASAEGIEVREMEMGGDGEEEGEEGEPLPSILIESKASAPLQDFFGKTMREIPFLEEEEHLEADTVYEAELSAKRHIRLGDPRRGAECSRGLAATKWQFIGGRGEVGPGILNTHLLAMHVEHKTTLALFDMTIDAVTRFMADRHGPTYILFSDASCAPINYWLPDNITNTPGVNDDSEEPPESFLNPILYHQLLANQSSGFSTPQHGVDFGPYWRIRELGDYLLLTHDKSDFEIWLTEEGFVCLAEGGGRLSTVTMYIYIYINTCVCVWVSVYISYS